MDTGMSYRERLLTKVSTYCRLTGRARSGVAKTVLNDTKFFERIEGGHGCTMDSYEKLIKWLDENMPPEPSESEIQPKGAG